MLHFLPLLPSSSNHPWFSKTWEYTHFFGPAQSGSPFWLLIYENPAHLLNPSKSCQSYLTDKPHSEPPGVGRPQLFSDPCCGLLIALWGSPFALQGSSPSSGHEICWKYKSYHSSALGTSHARFVY